MPNSKYADTVSALNWASKLIRVMNEAGVDFTPVLRSPKKRKNLVAYISLGCPEVDADGIAVQTFSDYDSARLILGDDFITPKEVMEARGLTYSQEQLDHLIETLPHEDVLHSLKNDGYMLLPTSPEALSVLDVRNINNQLFYSKTEGWYAKSKHVFSRQDKTPAGTWIAIRKDVVPNSMIKNWSEQQSLISNDEYIPNAAEFTWALTTYKEVRGVYLMGSIYARTASVDADGYHVCVGRFDADGLNVHYYCWDDNRNDVLGVASARKI